MDSPSSIFAPGAGEKIQEHQHFSSAVRIGNRVETSGQGGWNDALEIPTAVDDEIAAAFRNIGRILTKAGATWDHVVHINTYHVGGFPPIVNDTVVKLFRRYMLNHAPVWAQLGVEALDLPTMRFEIRVTAIIP
jgi:enamine deaminase RidA (YjgF/YER057c/UK114 family)